MTIIIDLLELDAIFSQMHAQSMRHALEGMLEKIAQNHNIDQERSLEMLVEREKLGSTAIGNGVAIPHALIEGITKPIACFARLKTPIKFDANDDKPVDLLFMLLVDKEHGAQHARTISHISRIMSQQSIQENLRNAKNRNEIHELFRNYESSANP